MKFDEELDKSRLNRESASKPHFTQRKSIKTNSIGKRGTLVKIDEESE